MSPTSSPAGPKPFVFILMPFDSSFNDVYTLGIKDSVEAAGAYAERVDEQLYQGSILDRIYNQITKADVIVADMSDRNPNVFYEVGYAHALNKVTILLTKSGDDIPFDLKHWPHIVYGNSITNLKSQLAPRLQWALTEAQGQPHMHGKQHSWHLELLVNNYPLGASPDKAVTVGYPQDSLRFVVRNKGLVASPPVTACYVWTHSGQDLLQHVDTLPREGGRILGNLGYYRSWPSIEVSSNDGWLGETVRQFRIDFSTTGLPPSGFELLPPIFLDGEAIKETAHINIMVRLVAEGVPHDFYLNLVRD